MHRVVFFRYRDALNRYVGTDDNRLVAVVMRVHPTCMIIF